MHYTQHNSPFTSKFPARTGGLHYTAHVVPVTCTLPIPDNFQRMIPASMLDVDTYHKISTHRPPLPPPPLPEYVLPPPPWHQVPVPGSVAIMVLLRVSHMSDRTFHCHFFSFRVEADQQIIVPWIILQVSELNGFEK